MKTYMAKADDVQRQWHIIDATGVPLGRMAARVARILQGKHKPTWTPHVDTGDAVIIINAGKVGATGRKAESKMYHRHTGYIGGLKTTSLGTMRANNPEELIRLAVKRMLPRGPLGRAMAKKLRVFKDANHSHTAQQPVVMKELI